MGQPPRFVPLPHDLMLFHGWGAVGLCGVAAGLAAAMRVFPTAPTLLVPAWGAVAAIAAACPVLLLDVVGGVLPGLGIPLTAAAILSRAGMFAGGVLLVMVALRYRRRLRDTCVRCGRNGPTGHADRVWVWPAAYAAIAGYVVRVMAQALSDLGLPYESGAALLWFDVGFVPAGSLVPLALVHRFGLVWPCWVLPLAGGPVPRWLVLVPGLFVGSVMTVYFGFSLVEFAAGTLGLAPPDDSGMPLSFMWTPCRRT